MMEALNYQYLTNPMAPEKFSEVTAKYINEISAYEFFSNPKNVKLQEAWILGRFGEHINALSVNLNTEKFPDAFAQVDHKTIKLEICEAYNPGRHRSREYEEDKTGKWSYDPVENWMPRCKASIAGLKTTVNKKMSKNYIQKCHLLIYISNTGVNSGSANNYNPEEDFMKKEIPLAVAPALDTFESIWVLWNGNLGQFKIQIS